MALADPVDAAERGVARRLSRVARRAAKLLARRRR